MFKWVKSCRGLCNMGDKKVKNDHFEEKMIRKWINTGANETVECYVNRTEREDEGFGSWEGRIGSGQLIVDRWEFCCHCEGL